LDIDGFHLFTKESRDAVDKAMEVPYFDEGQLSALRASFWDAPKNVSRQHVPVTCDFPYMS
jgi:hypothetical protein